MNSSLYQKLLRELEQRKSKKLLRELKAFRTNKIDFSSNDYLGLNFEGIMNQFLLDALENYKKSEIMLGSTGSRLISGQREIFEEVEKQFSLFIKNSDSLYFTNGYTANLSTIFALLTPKDYAIVDQYCHASILDGIRISRAKKIYFRHNDSTHLEEIIKKIRKKDSKNFIWIFTEAIFSMDGDSPHLEQIILISKKYDCAIFLDEAHSIGIVGEKGVGFSSNWNLQGECSVITYPLGKAIGLMGCFVVGDSLLKQYLINFARGFVFSTAIPILILYILQRVISYLSTEEAEKKRKKVKELSDYAREQLQRNGYHTGFSNSHIIPILIGDEEETLKLSEYLKKRNFNVVAIRPPTVPLGTSRIRLNIHSHNTKEEIDQFIYEINQYRSKQKSINNNIG
ncbi:MAG: aminotransferase class I/II-fold pyridoxal phosphate-dependent enzyme [Leptonema sp. (in: bacteria)]